MKISYLFFIFIFLFLNTSSNALTSDFSDNCTTLSLTGPDTDPGEDYFIEISGKVNSSGYSYYGWLYVDGDLQATESSSTETSFSKKIGPFTGPHKFTFTMQGNAAHGLCKRSVELTVAPRQK